jgi:hypothetical protein
VLPTIADVLGMTVPWGVDGRSLRNRVLTTTDVVVKARAGGNIAAAAAIVTKGVARTADRKASLFGEGDGSVYRVGRNRWALGLRIMESRLRTMSTRIRIEDEELLADVRTASPSIPSRISGSVQGVELSDRTEIAVALNGRVVALARWFPTAGGQRFLALVPEHAFRDGYNRIDVYAVESGFPEPSLVWLGGGPDRDD